MVFYCAQSCIFIYSCVCSLSLLYNSLLNNYIFYLSTLLLMDTWVVSFFFFFFANSNNIILSNHYAVHLISNFEWQLISTIECQLSLKKNNKKGIIVTILDSKYICANTFLVILRNLIVESQDIHIYSFTSFTK